MAILNSNEVCERLGIKLNHLYQLKYRKQLVPHEKTGRKAYYTEEAVEAFKAMRNAKNS